MKRFEEKLVERLKDKNEKIAEWEKTLITSMGGADYKEVLNIKDIEAKEENLDEIVESIIKDCKDHTIEYKLFDVIEGPEKKDGNAYRIIQTYFGKFYVQSSPVKRNGKIKGNWTTIGGTGVYEDREKAIESFKKLVNEPMNHEADHEHIEDTIKSKLQEAYREILEHHGIESGDITPEEQLEMDNAEDELVDATESWIANRVHKKVLPLPTDAEYIGEEVVIQSGEYERTNYLEEGGSHTDQYLQVDEPTKGVIVEEVFEGKMFYNVAVRNNDHQTIFFLVKKENLEL